MGNSGSSSLGIGYGYRIISIEPNSFGSNLNLEIFLDYIIQIKTDSQINALKLLESDEPIELSIYNIISQETRKIYISEPRSSTKLGLQIRYEPINPLILHITNVLNGSPAEECGLQKNTDYLLGMMSHRYNSIDEFSDIVTGQAYSKQEIELCIFSPSSKKQIKILKLLPRYNWGGPGSLGCEFATGALHNFSFSKLLKLEQEQIVEQCKQKQANTNEIQQDDPKLINNEQVDEQKKQEIQSVLSEKQGENQEIDLSLSIIESQSISIKIIVANQILSPTNQILSQDVLIDPIKNSDSKENQSQSDEQEKKEELILQQNEATQNGRIEQTPTNLPEDEKTIISHQQEIEEQGELHKFRGLLRFQEQGQEQYVEKEDHKQTDNLNTSFQSKNGSSDYSHLQQNQMENLRNQYFYQALSLTTSTLQENKEEKPTVAKYVNQLVFKSPKREQMYIVDKKLLFDIQFEVPKYYVNIY